MSFNVKTRLSKLVNSAKARGIRVNLDVNKYQNLINFGCHYCGTDLKNENGYCLDRVDSSRGYSLTNVVGCCKICNRAKSNMEIWEFVNWLKKANDYTMAAIEYVKNEEAKGKDYSLEEELRIHDMLSKGKEKHRIKF